MTTPSDSPALEVLRRFAWCRDHFGGRGEDYPTHFPVWTDPWENSDVAIELAIKGLLSIGYLEGGPAHFRITDAGYAWFKSLAPEAPNG